MKKEVSSNQIFQDKPPPPPPPHPSPIHPHKVLSLSSSSSIAVFCGDYFIFISVHKGSLVLLCISLIGINCIIMCTGTNFCKCPTIGTSWTLEAHFEIPGLEEICSWTQEAGLRSYGVGCSLHMDLMDKQEGRGLPRLLPCLGWGYCPLIPWETHLQLSLFSAPFILHLPRTSSDLVIVSDV